MLSVNTKILFLLYDRAIKIYKSLIKILCLGQQRIELSEELIRLFQKPKLEHWTVKIPFLPARISPKENSGASGGFLPKPLLLRLRHPNSKKMRRVFCEILSPKNSFGKTESAFRPATLPEYLEGRTPKEKHPFFFQKKFHPPRQIRNATSVFLSGLPRLCEAVAG